VVRKTTKLLLTLLALVALAVMAVPALAAGGAKPAKHAKPPKHAKLFIKGQESFKPNAYIKNTLRWVPGTVVIASGGTLTIVNRSKSDEPHTFSIVKRSQLPRTLDQIENCAVCGDIAKAHGVDPTQPPSGPPPILTVDLNNDGFNEPGDSQFIAPHQTVHLQITAKRGAKLYFMCAIHPWMQGVVKVR
jgi:hypothetical protein